METVVKALYNASFAIWNTLIGIAMTIFRTSPTAVSGGTPYIIRTENVRTFGYPSVWWKRQRLCGSTDHVKNAQTKYRIRQEDCYFSFRKTENVITAGGIVPD